MTDSHRQDPIRLIEHNLIDICDVLEASFALDGTEVSFVARGEGRPRWTGQLGDWLVPDPGPTWRIVSDVEFGRLHSAPAREEAQSAPAPVTSTRASLPSTTAHPGMIAS